MLDDIFDEVLTNKGFECVVQKWLKTLTSEEQSKVAKIHQMERDVPQSVDLAKLFTRLRDEVEITFKLTSFRQHFRDRCTCRPQ